MKRLETLVMVMQDSRTGDTIELPRPDFFGHGVVKFNGRAVLSVTYSDHDGGTITTEDGRIFRGNEFPKWIVEQINNGVWRDQA